MEIDTKWQEDENIWKCNIQKEILTPAPAKTKVKLKAYGGGRIPVLGLITAKVVYEEQAADLQILTLRDMGHHCVAEIGWKHSGYTGSRLSIWMRQNVVHSRKC